MAATLAFALIAARRIAFVGPIGITMGVLWLAAAALGYTFLRTVSGKCARLIETWSGVWSLALYLTLGVIPLCLRR
jgi:4-hydroxybenzoate polyprenyltransferase